MMTQPKRKIRSFDAEKLEHGELIFIFYKQIAQLGVSTTKTLGQLYIH